MPLDTRQKVLIGIIIILSIIVTAEIGLLIKLKVEHQQLNIPFLHKIGLVRHIDADNKSITATTRENNSNNVNTSVLSAATPINNTNTVVTPSVVSATSKPPVNNNSLQDNNGNTLTDADKKYIQSLVNLNLAPINGKLKQNEAAITVANNNATQALAAVNAAQTSINNRFTKDEAAIAAANENNTKTFAELSSTITTTTDRLAKDEVAITQANKNASKLLADITANAKRADSAGQVNQQLVNTTSEENASIPTVSKSAPETVTKQERISSSSHPATANKQANLTSYQQGHAKAPNSQSVVVSQNSNNPIAAISHQPCHKYHHISQLPDVYGRIMRSDPSAYTIQLIADNGLKSLYEYMWAYCLGYSATPLHTKHFGQNWYVLIYGQFTNVYQANAALQQFPYSALKWRPFVRRMSDVQRMITDPRGEDALVGQKQSAC